MFYLRTNSIHFNYGCMTSDIWERTTQIAREKTHFQHFVDYSFRLAARDLLYSPFHRRNSIYNCLYYTRHRTLAETRNNWIGPPWEIDPTTYRINYGRSSAKLRLAPINHGVMKTCLGRSLDREAISYPVSSIHRSQWLHNCSGARCSSVVERLLTVYVSSDRSHCAPRLVCGMVHKKEPLLVIGKSSPCGSSGFPLLLSQSNQSKSFI